jgi:hypothetical protein
LGFGLFAALHSRRPQLCGHPQATAVEMVYGSVDAMMRFQHGGRVSFRDCLTSTLRETAPRRQRHLGHARAAHLHFTPIRPSAWRRDSSSTNNSFLLLAAASACPAMLCCDSAIRALSQYLDQYKCQCLRGRRLTRRLSSQWLWAAVP